MNDSFGELTPYRRLSEAMPPPPVAADPFSETELPLRAYWRALRKRRVLVAAIVLGVTASTAVYSLTRQPKYTATAVLQIEPEAPNVAPVLDVSRVNATEDRHFDYYETQFEILKSRPVIARVVGALNLGADRRFLADSESGPKLTTQVAGWLGWTNGSSAGEAADKPTESQLVGAYEGGLKINPAASSRLVQVRYTSASPELAAEIANSHVQQYIDLAIDQRRSIAERARVLLGDELAKAKQRLILAEAALSKFRADKRIVSADGDKSDIVTEGLHDLSKQLNEAKVERIGLESQYKLIQKRDVESLPAVLESGLVNSLKQEASKLEAERADLEKIFFPEYPKLQQAAERERQVKSRLRLEINKIVGGIESAYVAAKSREQDLLREVESQTDTALGQKTLGAEFETLRRNAETARSLHGALLERLSAVDVSREINVSNISIFDKADVPGFPSSPRKVRDVSIAFVGSMLFAVLLAFLLERLDNTLKTPEDVERRIGLPTLGVIPSFDGELATKGPRKGTPRETSGAHELVIASDPRSVIAEAYRVVRTGILLSSADRPPQITLFTSGSPEEGKTLTSVNHALTLVQSGARVLIIDADFRRPRIHRIFGLPNGHGLSSYLADQSPFDKAIHAIPLNGQTPEVESQPKTLLSEGHGAADGNGNGNGHAKSNGFGNGHGQVRPGSLSVLVAGPTPPNPAELVGSRRMRETLDLLRTQFDFIVIDAPPVLPVTDAIPLSPMCDATVLVVRGQSTTYRGVARARDRLRYARANLIGVVLNRVDVHNGDYDGDSGYYDSYYYYAEENAAASKRRSSRSAGSRSAA
jgi:polysaccharide biosynthesis transport protein